MILRGPGILLAWLFFVSACPGMKVGTYNIRYDTPGDARKQNEWTRRSAVVAALVRFHDFDVLGTQEGFKHQMDDLGRALPEHARISYGRDDGKEKGEHVGIFYRKDRFEAVEIGMFWLSEHPERPGKGWDADLPRICTWAKFRRKSDGWTFCFMAVHMDHHGAVARKESARLLVRKSAELSGSSPVFLVGDFNSDQDSEAYKLITGSGSLVDSASCSQIVYQLNGTANRFDPDAMTVSRIDHVFVSRGTRVRRFGVLTDSYRVPEPEPVAADGRSSSFPSEVRFRKSLAHLPSDHFPVLVETIDP